jgi:hypothetical protein
MAVHQIEAIENYVRVFAAIADGNWSALSEIY